MLSVKNVEITSEFWKRYRELVVKEVLPYQWDVMNDEADIDISINPQGDGRNQKSNAVANLKIAAGQMDGHHYGFPFQDTDVYKWLEAVAYSFEYHPNPDLQQITDRLIDLIADAQDDDGYLSTFFQIDAPERKFKRLQQSHELYSMGHYIEAGVSYYEATGNEKALEIARRMGDCMIENFGLEDGKIHGYDGHPEVELALVRLYETTNEDKYLELAHYFLNQRGQNPDFFDNQNKADGWDNELLDGMRDLPRTYYQSAEPIKDQQTADGHAVRVVYLCTGMAYVARYTHDQDLLEACHRFWNDIVNRRMYITGNIGSTTTGEAFTYDYDLPNDTMYGETCASVGMAFFARQMLNIEANGSYADVLEKELFNGSISGMALDGKHFYYVNPLEADPEASQGNPGKSHILTHRADWFGCACCPANLARLITSVDKYLYTVNDNQILSHQFIANKTQFDNGIVITQQNNFPWEGNIQYDITGVETATSFGIRIPGWSMSNYSLVVNDVQQELTPQNGFVYLDITGDTHIELTLDMSVKFMQSNNLVRADYDKTAIMRGPLVYAAEQEDNSAPLWLYRVDTKQEAQVQYESELLNGVVTINLAAKKEKVDSDTSALYHELTIKQESDVVFKMVPYYSWANRSDGQMMTWINY
ncbi:glycoside hydrolase family 127 protein [Weissella bombi]|uniref:DUF1680 family protein n=1 Tax=Weissella bombi TaxID=1505725 RepID=A0A1C4BKE8_9LACO|nr:beta-L-arabinofuranosidase domain-containing protein [Weissella bombi]SCC07335.1 hypothetical protein GA0061074_11241 [Weissella bombi]